MSMTPGTLETAADQHLEPEAAKRIEGRSLGQLAWARLRKDHIAMTGGVVALLLILLAIASLPMQAIGWLHPYESDQDALSIANAMPQGAWGGVSWEHPLGVEPQTGRDVMDRVIVGARVSLGIAGAATLLAVSLGVLVGVIAGYFRGWVDTLLSRLMDLMLAFPVLLFAIALLVILRSVDSIGPSWLSLSGNSLSIAAIISIIGGFGWAYPARIIRGQVLSLREKEFVEAARSLGARNSRILFKELLPNLVAPILVYATLILPVNIITEAALSFLGVGINPPTPSWGQMISQAAGTARLDPFYLVVPGMAIFITVLSFNLFGDGLRDAVDPKSSR